MTPRNLSPLILWRALMLWFGLGIITSMPLIHGSELGPQPLESSANVSFYLPVDGSIQSPNPQLFPVYLPPVEFVNPKLCANQPITPFPKSYGHFPGISPPHTPMSSKQCPSSISSISSLPSLPKQSSQELSFSLETQPPHPTKRPTIFSLTPKTTQTVHINLALAPCSSGEYNFSTSLEHNKGSKLKSLEEGIGPQKRKTRRRKRKKRNNKNKKTQEHIVGLSHNKKTPQEENLVVWEAPKSVTTDEDEPCSTKETSPISSSPREEADIAPVSPQTKEQEEVELLLTSESTVQPQTRQPSRETKVNPSKSRSCQTGKKGDDNKPKKPRMKKKKKKIKKKRQGGAPKPRWLKQREAKNKHKHKSKSKHRSTNDHKKTTQKEKLAEKNPQDESKETKQENVLPIIDLAAKEFYSKVLLNTLFERQKAQKKRHVEQKVQPPTPWIPKPTKPYKSSNVHNFGFLQDNEFAEILKSRAAWSRQQQEQSGFPYKKIMTFYAQVDSKDVTKFTY